MLGTLIGKHKDIRSLDIRSRHPTRSIGHYRDLHSDRVGRTWLSVLIGSSASNSFQRYKEIVRQMFLHSWIESNLLS